MKKQIKSVILMTIVALTAASCGSKDQFKETKLGLQYKFLVENKNAQPVKEGDVIVGELVMRFNNDTLLANVGNPQRILRVAQNMFDGDLPEGLLMLHQGDEAIFAVDADKMAKFFGNQMPQTYKPGQGDKLYYEVKVLDIVSADEINAEQENFEKNMEEAAEGEAALIEAYVKENNITVAPSVTGVYVVVNKKGNGAKVAAGKQVAMHYTGRLLDGTVFDSSEGKDPLSYTVGVQSLIPGWEEGVMGQPAGTKLTVVIPSDMAYGSRGAGRTIPPYSPLVFDIEIVSVN